MTDEALQYLNKGEGFEVGVGLSIGVVDTAVVRMLRTMTVTQDIYAFIFGWEGLMAGLGLQGSKITKIER
jgi:lipid-binding SYLF domain-containing protein